MRLRRRQREDERTGKDSYSWVEYSAAPAWTGRERNKYRECRRAGEEPQMERRGEAMETKGGSRKSEGEKGRRGIGKTEKS